jgi:hypothetical protein
MEVFLARLCVFSLLPVLLGLGLILLDSSTKGRLRRSEALLIPLFVIGVAGSGIGGFVAHVFISDEIAESVGWQAGSPFQLEVGFANLAIGILGAVAAERRDGFREATVIAVTVFSLGATYVHVLDIRETGNLAPGNTLQNVSNVIRPILLISLLAVSRRAERTSNPPDMETLDVWRVPILRASVVTVTLVSSAFAIGFGTGQPIVISGFGAAVACIVFAAMMARARIHGVGDSKP